MPALSPSKQLLVTVFLTVALLVVSVSLKESQVMERWDNLVYDLESAAISKPVDDNIVIVAIDEASLRILGRWPWPRATHARLLKQLEAAKAAAIGLDILFMEADPQQPQGDRFLAETILRSGRVVLPVLTSGESPNVMVVKPITPIAEAAHLAHVNMLFDNQGIARQLEPRIILDTGDSLPAMALALHRLAGFDSPPLESVPAQAMLIPFAGPPGYFKRISFVDVLLKEEVRRQLQGKIVLVGMTAEGLGRRIATPVSKADSLMTGVEFQANALAAIQSGRLIHPLGLPAYTLLSLLLIVVPVALYPLLRPRSALLVMLAFSALTWVCGWLLLGQLQLWFAPMSTLLCLVLAFPLCSWRKLEQLGHSLFKEHEKARVTLKAVDNAVIATDRKGRVEFMNPAAEKMLACTLKEAKRRPFDEICRIQEPKDSRLPGQTPENVGQEWGQTRVIRNQNGTEYTVRVSSSPLYSERGEPFGFVYALSDLTEIVSISRRIAFLAAHDTLTGLPNRVLLQDRLQQAISAAIREQTRFALLFVDLDGFKKINDGMGHACGDLLLQEVAQRLRGMVRQSDTVARWGGDEFVLLLEDVKSPPGAADVAAKVILSLSQPFVLNGEDVFVTPSIGISLFPTDGRQGEMLLAKADAAMYSVKKHGRNNFRFYSEDLDSLSRDRLIMEKELYQALHTEQFELFYQPQIELDSGRLIGAEALIRWRHPQKGMIAPDQFIPLAEELGLIVPIGEWVIRTVCRQIKSWEESGLEPIRVAINLSPRQFMQKDLVDIITREIQKQRVCVDRIQVEITESMIIDDIERVIEILNNLKANGISIAIDDFGTGFSSLEYLKRFPIDKLKIDKSFVGNVLHNQDDASIVQAVIALGHNMNMQIIAEGVESEEQLAFLKQRRCDYGQGYFFSKPVAEHEMREIIATRSAKADHSVVSR